MVIEKENLEKPSLLPSSPWESRKWNEDFLCVCVNIRRWQAAPSFFFFFFFFWKAFPCSEWVWHVCPILLSFDIFFEPFHKFTCHGLKMGVPHCRLAGLELDLPPVWLAGACVTNNVCLWQTSRDRPRTELSPWRPSYPTAQRSAEPAGFVHEGGRIRHGNRAPAATTHGWAICEINHDHRPGSTPRHQGSWILGRWSRGGILWRPGI